MHIETFQENEVPNYNFETYQNVLNVFCVYIYVWGGDGVSVRFAREMNVFDACKI